MSYYQHKALESPIEQIRLIHLFPQGYSNDSPELVRCTVEHVSLNIHPEFTALSYVWGSPERSHRIMINDAYFKVTESLETMLRHIQSSSEVLTLWIDQLCINQDDVNEKNAQVKLMKEIYPKALQTIVWLGPASTDSACIMEFLADVGGTAYNFGLLRLTMTQFQNFSDGGEQDEDLRNIKNSMNTLLTRIGTTFPVEAFKNLIARSWFTRVWVVQEVSLGNDIVFRCGGNQLSYDQLRAASFFYVFYTSNIASRIRVFDLNSLVESSRMIKSLNSVDQSPLLSMLTARRKYQSQTGNKGEPLYILLKRLYVKSAESVRLAAMDPRDRIYGLLGLANDSEDIEIDYGMSCTDLYSNVARKLINQGHVDLLELCQGHKTLTSADGVHLPSWVPDWTGTILKPCGELSELSTPFSVSVASSATVIESHQLNAASKILTLKGVYVDQVDLVGTVYNPTSGDLSPSPDHHVFLREVYKFCEKSAQRDKIIYKDPKRQAEAVWRVPIGDKEFSTGSNPLICRATMKSHQGYELIYRTFTEIEREREKMNLLGTMIAQRKAGFDAAGTSSAPVAVPRDSESRISGGSMGSLTQVTSQHEAESHAPGSLAASAPSTPFSSGGSTLINAIMRDMQDPAAVSYLGMMEDMRNRRPFLSQGGYVGLGPAGMKSGDIICVLFGGRVPYILRTHESGHFQVMGEAYCDGIMDWGVKEGDPREEIFMIS